MSSVFFADPDLAEHYDEDGNYYFGTLSDGKYQGYGEWFNRYYIILDKDRNRYVVSYKGEWLNGGYHGAGDLLMSDGSHYQGQWVLGEKHGSGTLVSADGERYDGQWRDNKRHGRGTCSAKGESGDCFYFDGEVLTYSGETDQQGFGQWENDKISGFGELDGYASGEFTYKGEFKNDLFDGQGTYAANNRGYYKGQWKAGKKQGQGVYRSNAESAFIPIPQWIKKIPEPMTVMNSLITQSSPLCILLVAMVNTQQRQWVPWPGYAHQSQR